jgi:hypothetical protein
MGKKSRNKQKLEEKSAREPIGLQPGSDLHRRRPTVLFGVGDADYGYTEGKILRLASRIKAHSEYNLKVVTHDKETSQEARKLGLDVQLIRIESPGVTVEERLRTTDEMIRETANIDIPGSTLPLWKVLAMDDFLCSLQLFGAQPADSLEGDIVLAPLMSVDNNTKAASGLYTWMVSEARRMSIPVVGFEVSPLGNKYTLSHLPADHYAVKNEWSKEFLVQQGLAHPDDISVLRWEESYCLWAGHDDYTESYMEHEEKIRAMLNIGWDEFIILIPHHVAFLWEVRKVLESLASLDFPLTVVIRVDPRTVRRHYVERELVLETYGKEIRRLPRVIIDEQVGVGLLLQLADLVISPFAGTTTERASLCRKPTIICQGMGQQGPRGEFTYWEPRPEQIPQLIHAWKENGFLARRRLDQSIKAVLDKGPRSSLPVSEIKRSLSEDVELEDVELNVATQLL